MTWTRLLRAAPLAVPVGTRNTATLAQRARGTAGRSSDAGYSVAVFGCTGFLGRYTCNHFGKAGVRLLTPYRGADDDVRHLRVMGDVGQVVHVPYDPDDVASLDNVLANSDVVYNLAGKDVETAGWKHDDVHHRFPKLLAERAAVNNVERFVHVSALGADEQSPSRFLQSKALGEKAVRKAFPGATIVRPGTAYGAEDNWLTTYAALNRKMHFNVVIDGGKAPYRPTFVHDIGKALFELRDERFAGRTVELYGEESNMQELIEVINTTVKESAVVVDVPLAVAKRAAAFVEPLPMAWFTQDTVTRLALGERPSNDKDVLTFADIGIEPQPLDSVAIQFLRMFRKGNVYHDRVESTIFEPDVEYPVKDEDGYHAEDYRANTKVQQSGAGRV